MRVEISVIAQIDAFFQPLLVVNESAILRGCRIQKQQAQASRLRGRRRKIENQALDGERRLALPQIIEPDQPEREHAIRVAGIRRGADGRPCRLRLAVTARADRRATACAPDPLRWSARQVCTPEIAGAEIGGTVREIPAGRCCRGTLSRTALLRSINSSVPCSLPKRATLSTSFPRVSLSMAMTRRTRLRRYGPRPVVGRFRRALPAQNFWGVMASHSSPGSHSTGSWLRSRKRSMVWRSSIVWRNSAGSISVTLIVR